MTTGQSKWRRCHACGLMFFNGQDRRGRCSSGKAGHIPFGLNFELPCGEPEQGHSPGWRLCAACLALHWAPAEDQACPAGSRHSPYGPAFALPPDRPETADGQSHWRCCAACAGLFFELTPAGRCAAGGAHIAAGPMVRVPHRADHVYDSGPISTHLPVRSWAQLTAQADGGWTLSTHAGISGAEPVAYAMTVVLVNRFGPPFAFVHCGQLDGADPAANSNPPRLADNRTSSGLDPRLREQYDNVADADIYCTVTEAETLLPDGASAETTEFPPLGEPCTH